MPASSPAPPPSRPAEYAWPDEIGLAPTPKNRPGPNYKEYFNAVWLQLLNPDEESERLLSLLLRGLSPPAHEKYQGYAHFVESRGPTFALQAQWMPPPDAQYIVRHREGGCCDLVRTRYRVASLIVDLGTARNIQLLSIRGFERGDNTSPLDDVTRVAKSLFDSSTVHPVTGVPPSFHWIQINDSDGTQAEDPAYGCNDVSAGSPSPFDYYVDKMHWVIRPGEIAFISSRGHGYVTQDFPSVSAAYNSHWFGSGKLY